MQKTQLIDILKDPIIAVVKDKRIVPSILIAESIYILDSQNYYDIMDDLVSNNNPFAIKAGKRYNGKTYRKNNVRYKSFATMELGVYAYINAHSKRFDKILNLLRYEDVLEQDETLTDTKKEELRLLITGYSLNKFDDILVDTIKDSTTNIIEIPKENENTKFYQKMHDCEPEREKVTPELIIKRESEKEEKLYKEKIQRGNKITLVNANLYQKAYSKMPVRNINGSYYISTKIENNRCGIVMKKEYCGNNNFLIGFVNVSELK